jgi:hypothetical protein
MQKLVISNLVLERVARQARRSHVVIDLTAKEFQHKTDTYGQGGGVCYQNSGLNFSAGFLRILSAVGFPI